MQFHFAETRLRIVLERTWPPIGFWCSNWHPMFTDVTHMACGPTLAESNRNGLNRTGLSRTELNRTGLYWTALNRIEPNRTESTRTERNWTELNRIESRRMESHNTEENGTHHENSKSSIYEKNRKGSLKIPRREQSIGLSTKPNETLYGLKPITNAYLVPVRY